MNKCVIDIHFHGINIIVDVLLFHIYYASLVLILHLNIIIYHFFLHNNIVTFFIITNSKINRFEILWCFGKHSKTLRNFFFIEFGSFFWAYFHFILLAMHQLTFNLKKKQFYKMQYSSYEDKQEILTQASKTVTKYITLYDFIFTLQQA